MDIAILNTWLLTFHDGLGIIENGAIGIDDGIIVFIGKSDDLKHSRADLLIDGTNHITMPGLINAHTHSGYTLLRGGAQDLPEIEWMNKGLGPFASYLKPKDHILGAKLAVLEGLRSGTTLFTEYAGNVAQLIKEVFLPYNVRVVAVETINEVSSDRAHLKPTDLYDFDISKGESALKKAKDNYKEFKDEALVYPMFGPQALDFCSIELLKSVKEEAKEHSSKIHMHVAQGERERLQIKGRYGSSYSTIRILKQNRLLDESLISVHMHDTTSEERLLMVKNDVKMVGCPSAISLIDGIVPPIGHYTSLGGEAALGTDQAPGPGHHNLFQEMRMISVLTKVINKDPTSLPPWEALHLTTIGGAKVLGLDDVIGSLVVGRQADIITINLKSLNLTPIVSNPFKNFIPNLVYSSTGKEVDNVIINGKMIISNGNFINVDEQSIITEANIRTQKIFEQATDDWVKAGSQMVSYRNNGFI
ncbi:MAG: amidohydrolase family protein [Candidatus Hodarchaeales archaeon]